MQIISREYNHSNDFKSVCQFLFNTYKETKSLHNWFPDRFENINLEELSSDIHLWEEINETKKSTKNKIVAIANPESSFIYFIQLHPDYNVLEKEIIQWIETYCSEKKKDPDKNQKLYIVTVEGNLTRESILTELSFEKGQKYGYLRFRDINLPVPEFSFPEGFEIRSVKGPSEYDLLAQGVRLIFGHGDWFTGEIIEWITKRSFYQQDLDLVAVAPNGTIASFCTIRIDPISRIAQLEPLATHPDYRKLGLAKVLLYEGIKRLKKYNPLLLYIGGAADTPGANRLYDSVGFTKKLALYYWFKEI
ncbi:MAG: GNAT family N-acetyltransferase [Candidatus Hodarchaeales archaeon]|jgi:ribosomal protein S18 acetylase RimI-like enzyme